MVIDTLLVTKIMMQLRNVIEFTRKFPEAEYISLLIKDYDTLKEKYEQICHKIRYKIASYCDSEPVHHDKHIKTKVKSYNGRITIDFHGSRMPKDGSSCNGLSIILLDFVFKIGKYYYPQVFLVEFKYITKEKKGKTY